MRISELDSIYLTRVTTKQKSTLSNQKVLTRADAYLIKTYDHKINVLLNQNNNYIDENILLENNIDYNFVPYSGLSIKLPDSKNFQILKLTPSSFKSLFKISELGAGACLYDKKEIDLVKNKDLIKGWLSSIDNMNNFFSHIIKNEKDFFLKKNICKTIKNQSISSIIEMIENNTILQEKIFNGKYIYQEPYTAYFISHNKSFERLKYIPYFITTGSGRSKGDYTLVLKPKSQPPAKLVVCSAPRRGCYLLHLKMC